MQAYEWEEGRKGGRKDGRSKAPQIHIKPLNTKTVSWSGRSDLLFTSMTELNMFMMDTWIQT